MRESPAVCQGLANFYERYSSHDPDAFAEVIATGDGVSVIGSAPGEGEGSRQHWLAAYERVITDTDIRLEGGENPRGFEEGSVGFAVDSPRFVLPDGSFLRTRLTAVLHVEAATWKVVHLHFSVGVPDQQAIRKPAGGS